MLIFTSPRLPLIHLNTGVRGLISLFIKDEKVRFFPGSYFSGPGIQQLMNNNEASVGVIHFMDTLFGE